MLKVFQIRAPVKTAISGYHLNLQCSLSVSPAANASESVHHFLLADVNAATVPGLEYRVLNCHVLLLCFVLLPYPTLNVGKT